MRERVPTPRSCSARCACARTPLPNRARSRAMGGVGETAILRCTRTPSRTVTVRAGMGPTRPTGEWGPHGTALGTGLASRDRVERPAREPRAKRRSWFLEGVGGKSTIVTYHTPTHYSLDETTSHMPLCLQSTSAGKGHCFDDYLSTHEARSRSRILTCRQGGMAC
jgi:hypothetical protein